MRLTERLKKQFASLLGAMLLLQVLPMSTMGQKPNLRQKAMSQEAAEIRQDQADQQAESADRGSWQRKIAVDLEQRVDAVNFGRSRDKVSRVIIQLRDKGPAGPVGQNVKGIMVTDAKSTMLADPSVRAELQTKFARYNGSLKNTFNTMGLISVEMPLSRIRDLEYDDDIAYISPDRPIASHGHVENTIGASQTDGRTEVPGFTSLNGTGVGIAVLDSGIDNTHNLIKASTGRPSVVYSKTYTGIAGNRDYFGHGTHVASLLAGSPGFKSDYYGGVAYESKVISLAVLDGSGVGLSSNVIAAIDWCITNKATYNIRVINMSLGAPASDSYKTDPLCLAARRAYNAGIVVVVAAGNHGKDSLGHKVYGGIDSPGIEPSVITVGATNSFGTDSRADDTIATYSSRGPTRGYSTDASGIKHYDNLIKPDLVAPGNKLIGAVSPSSVGKLTSLVTLFPSLKVGSSTTYDQCMYLSGTSMSTPVVAGAAAMMLEANPNLTPGLVKAILMYTAQPLQNFNTLEQGAGRLNVEGAVRIAGWVKSDASTLTNGASMLNSWNEGGQDNSIGSENVAWGRGVVTNYCVLYGSALMTKWQAMYAQGDLLADATSVTGGILSRNLSLVSSGVYNTAGPLTNTGVLISDGVLLADGVLLSDGVLLADGVLLGDGVLISDGVLLGDGVLISDGVLLSDSALGDNTAAMQPAP
jgi:serine protease AprX